MKKADLIVWLSTLPEEDPRLEAVEAVRNGHQAGPDDEPLLSLKALAEALGFQSYTALHKLGIQRVGESWGGGRKRYRRSVAEAYLRSPECMAVRDRIRRKRRERQGQRRLEREKASK